jgi:hypothetical protein
MRSLILAALLLPACTPAAPAGAHEQALMDEIEASIHLPADARPLSAYGRSYSYASGGRVEAVYLIPSSPPPPNDGCDVMTADLKSRPCTASEISDAKARDVEYRASHVPAGERRWMKNHRQLPGIFDGGCAMVTVDYDAVSNRFLLVRCNGRA